VHQSSLDLPHRTARTAAQTHARWLTAAAGKATNPNPKATCSSPSFLPTRLLTKAKPVNPTNPTHRPGRKQVHSSPHGLLRLLSACGDAPGEEAAGAGGVAPPVRLAQPAPGAAAHGGSRGGRAGGAGSRGVLAGGATRRHGRVRAGEYSVRERREGAEFSLQGLPRRLPPRDRRQEVHQDGVARPQAVRGTPVAGIIIHAHAPRFGQ
jgi:hypothetical protein